MPQPTTTQASVQPNDPRDAAASSTPHQQGRSRSQVPIGLSARESLR
jgi:hypothetical protein